MTQATFEFGKPHKPTLTDRLEAHFKAHPGEWVNVIYMARLVGVSGVRQRRLEVEQRIGKLERKEWVDADGFHHLAFCYRPRQGAAA